MYRPIPMFPLPVIVTEPDDGSMVVCWQCFDYTKTVASVDMHLIVSNVHRSVLMHRSRTCRAVALDVFRLLKLLLDVD